MNDVLRPLLKGEDPGESASLAQEPSAKYLAELAPAVVRGFDLLATAPDGVRRLRSLLLKIALRGQLVPQISSDAPACAQLAAARAATARQMANGQVKREMPVGAVAHDEQEFALPSGWVWCRITDTGEYINGLAFKPSDWGNEGRPIIRIQNLSGRNLEFNRTTKSVDPSVTVSDGDILVSWSATLDTFIWRGEEGVLNQHIFRVAASTLVDKGFLFWLLKGVIKDLAASDHAHGLVMAHINRGPFLAHPVAIPPLAEQRRIVARVEELMKLCDALEQSGRLADEQHARLTSTLFDALAASESAHALAENWQRVAEHFDLLLDRPEAIDALEQTILQLAVRGLLVPQMGTEEPADVLLARLRTEQDRMVSAGLIRRKKALPRLTEEEQPFALPAGWCWARLGTLANFIDYRGRTPVKVTSGVPLITAKNVRQGFINREPREFIAADAYAGWMTRGLPRMGDLLFTTEAPLGNVAAIDITERFALAQRVICLGLYEASMSGALSTFLRSPWMQRALEIQATGVTAQGIKSARLQLMPMPVPPLHEQHRIVARVEELCRLCAQLREHLTEARRTQSQLADAIIAEATA